MGAVDHALASRLSTTGLAERGGAGGARVAVTVEVAQVVVELERVVVGVAAAIACGATGMALAEVAPWGPSSSLWCAGPCDTGGAAAATTVAALTRIFSGRAACAAAVFGGAA
jgi:hypothetical protein